MRNLPLDDWERERDIWRMWVMRNLPGSTVIGSIARFCMIDRSVFVRVAGRVGARAVWARGPCGRAGAWAEVQGRAVPGTPT